jgi:hypothetical protein
MNLLVRFAGGAMSRVQQVSISFTQNRSHALRIEEKKRSASLSGGS